MRQVGERLHRALEPAAPDFIEQQGKENAGGPGEQKIGQVQAQRVAQHAPEIVAAEKILEIFQADPGAARHAPANVKALKGSGQAVERRIAKKKIPRQHGQHNQIQLPMPLKISPENINHAALFHRAYLCGARAGHGCVGHMFIPLFL